MTSTYSSYHRTSVSQFLLPREVVYEMLHDRQIMGVDQLEVRIAICRVSQDMGEGVEGEEDRWPTGRRDFSPEGEEDRPCIFGFASTEFGQTEERDIALNWNGKSVFVGEFERGEDVFIGFGDLTQPVGRVCLLGVQGWSRLGYRSVIGSRRDEILRCRYRISRFRCSLGRLLALRNVNHNPTPDKRCRHRMKK